MAQSSLSQIERQINAHFRFFKFKLWFLNLLFSQANLPRLQVKMGYSNVGDIAMLAT